MLFLVKAEKIHLYFSGSEITFFSIKKEFPDLLK